VNARDLTLLEDKALVTQTSSFKVNNFNRKNSDSLQTLSSMKKSEHENKMIPRYDFRIESAKTSNFPLLKSSIEVVPTPSISMVNYKQQKSIVDDTEFMQPSL